MSQDLKIITCVVHRGHSQKVVDILNELGIEGYTIYQGRGIGIHEKQIKLLSYTIEPPKEIIFTIVQADDANTLLKQLEKAAEFDKPGNGLAFVQNIEEVVGINHPVDKITG